jgi:geranylgeranyl pyrophosphate synthase
MSASRVLPEEALPTADKVQQALAPVQDDLRAVSERLEQQLSDPLAKRVLYLIQAGGKRLRPALVLLCGRCGPSPKRTALINAAAAVELIHTATLVHDDIIDLSTLRRAQPTFHHRWGTERALLTGDYLYATAFAMLSELQDPWINRVIAQVCEALSLGELREVEARYQFDLTEQGYLDIIYAKTASLLEGCCRLGAHLGGFGSTASEALAAFGRDYGLAFQIVDDCLDLSSSATVLGKEALADLDKGVLSLPIIYLRESLTPEAYRGLFESLLAVLTSTGVVPHGPSLDKQARELAALEPALKQRIATLVRERGALERARAKAQALSEAAKAALRAAGLGNKGHVLVELADYAVARQS